MPRLSVTSLNTMIQSILVPGTTYNLALFVSDPDSTGATGEVTGGTYARQAIVFTSASNGVEYNTANITFAGLPALTSVPFIAIFTTGGTYIGGGASGFAGSINAGGTLQFPTGSVAAIQL